MRAKKRFSTGHAVLIDEENIAKINAFIMSNFSNITYKIECSDDTEIG